MSPLGGSFGVIGQAVVEMIGDNAQLKKDIDESKKVTEDATEEMSSGMEAFGASTKAAGQSMTKNITPAAAAVAVTMQGLFDAWQKGYETIRAETGATGDELEGLIDSAKRVAAGVTVPFEDVAAVLSEVRVRTQLTGEPLEALTKQILELAEVTGIDATSSVETFVKLLGSWKVATTEQAAALDLLFRASQQTGNGVDEIAAAATQARPLMEQLGFSFNETIALVSKMGASFPQTFAGLRMAVLNLSKDVTVANIPAEFERIVKSIGKAGSAAEANRIAVELFGSKAGPALAAQIRDGKFAIDDYVAALEGGTDTISKAREETLTFADRMLMLKNRIVGILGPSAQWAATFATIAAGAGPLLTAIGALITAVGGLTIASVTNSTVMVAMGVAWLSLVAMAGGVAAAIGIVTLAVAAVGAAIATWTMAYMAWQTANEEHAKSVEASGNFLEAYAKNVALGIHSMDEWKEKIKQVVSEEGLSIQEKAKLAAEADRLTQAMNDGSLSADANAQKQKALAAAHREASAAARKQWAAELALAGGLLGVQGAAFQVADAQDRLAAAQRKVNRLQENGKKGTKAYRDAASELTRAQNDAVQAHLGVANAVAQVKDQIKTGEITQKQAIDQIRLFGRMAGLSKGDIDKMVASIKNLEGRYGRTKLDIEVDDSDAKRGIEDTVRALFNLPSSKTITVNYATTGHPTGGYSQPVATGGIIAGASGFISKGPTLLVGEGTRQTFAGRGTEAVIPFDQRGIGILAEALSLAINKGRRPDAATQREDRRPLNLTIEIDGVAVSRQVALHQRDHKLVLGRR